MKLIQYLATYLCLMYTFYEALLSHVGVSKSSTIGTCLVIPAILSALWIIDRLNKIQ